MNTAQAQARRRGTVGGEFIDLGTWELEISELRTAQSSTQHYVPAANSQRSAASDIISVFDVICGDAGAGLRSSSHVEYVHVYRYVSTLIVFRRE